MPLRRGRFRSMERLCEILILHVIGIKLSVFSASSSTKYGLLLNINLPHHNYSPVTNLLDLSTYFS